MGSFLEWRRVFRSTRLICAAIVASLFIYALIVEILRSRLAFFAGLVKPEEARPFRVVLYSLAILSVLLTRFTHRRMMASRPGESLQESVLRLSRASVMTAVLAELPALLGFVLFLLAGSSWDFYFLWFASLVVEFILFPRSSAWESSLNLPGSGA